MKHDHRQSIWIIAGGAIVWCYRCGAWRLNGPNSYWQRPTGPKGKNPAMSKAYLKRKFIQAGGLP